MHPKLSATAIAYPSRPVEEDIRAFEEAGIPSIGVGEWRLAEHGWDREVATLRSSPVPIAYLIVSNFFTLDDPGRWPAERERLVRALTAARDCGAGMVYGTTGAAGALTFEAATDAYAEAVAPCVTAAAELDVTLCFETTAQLRQDLGFVSTLRDQIAVAEASGTSICLDLMWSWREAGLLASVAAAGPRIGMLQVSDYVPGMASMPDRAVPGDGIVPIEALLTGIHDAGFTGLVDVELLGPRIDAEGVTPAIARGVRHVAEILERVASPVPAAGGRR
jgi:sugar phosphate isomerase/epimerase